MVIDYVKEYERRTKLNPKNPKALIIPKTIQDVLDRHNRNLKQMKNKNFRYFYSVELADFAVKWIGTNIYEPKSGKCLLELGFSSFQTLIIAIVFGWREKPDGFTYSKYKKNEYDLAEMLLYNRRFKEILLTCARKQGKSMLLNGINIFDMFTKSTNANQCVYIANGADQAKIPFNMMINMLTKMSAMDKTKELENLLTINKETVVLNLSDGTTKFEAKVYSTNLKSADGADASNIFYDEMATATDDELYLAFETSQLHQNNRLNILTSTATGLTNSILKKTYLPKHESNNKELDSNKVDEQCIGFIYTQDDVEELNNLNELTHDEILNIFMKSNPILDLNKQIKIKNGDYTKRNHYTYLINSYRESVKKNTVDYFKIKHLNMFVQVRASKIVEEAEWKELSLGVTREEFYNNEINKYKGSTVLIGLDYGRVGDLASISSIININKNTKETLGLDYDYIVDSYTIVPYYHTGDVKNKSIADESNYEKYIEEGWAESALEENNGAITTEHFVEKVADIYEYFESKGISVEVVAYDKYKLDELITNLQKRIPSIREDELIEVSQSTYTTGRIVMQLQNDIILKRVRNIGNPLLLEHLLNTTLIPSNHNENAIRVEKAKSNLKIDNTDSLLTAYVEIQRTDDYIDYNSDDFSLLT